MFGTQCLVAWLGMCWPKFKGGLGTRSLGDQNRCLLAKLLHRLHSDIDSLGAFDLKDCR
jgi:hypothetical protein